MTRVRIIGPGRAGTSLHHALARAGVEVAPVLGRDDDVHAAALAVDLVVVATPDRAVAEVAAAITPRETTVVAHLSGALGLDALHPHPRRAVLHPLVTLPDAATGAERLAGCWFGVSAQGDPIAAEIVDRLGGRAIPVDEADWPRYHAAAVMASNHLVALLGQVERVAALVGAPVSAYLDLARGAVADVAALGAASALTGPVRRGDLATVAHHLDALPADERPGYEALAREAARLCP